MREQEQVQEARRIEVGEVRPGEPPEDALERGPVAGQLQREPVGGALPAPRDPRLERQRENAEHEQHEQDERNDLRIARPRGSGRGHEPGPRQERPEDQHRCGRSGHRQRRPGGDVAEAPVPQLVGDDDAKLVARHVREQRVEDDEPPRRPEPRDVGVVLARPAARIRDEHRPHRHAGLDRQLAQLARQLLVGQRPEAVEEPLEDDRRDQPQD
ncbi:MAG: hypothetical protein E6F97_05705 [Actinobacteria bacterium]|nr:MAG: hypothetical protein E6F97_05705 [Actinomycetota bacterium]